MTNHNVMMLAFLFPPTAAAGSFRALRFVKYLTEFGWTPFVVTVQAELTEYPVDESLAADIPAHATVERTSIWYPEEAIFGRIRRVLGKSSSRIADAVDTPSNQDSSATAVERNGHGAIKAFRDLRDRIFFTPDRDIAWSRPAIRAAHRILRNNRIDILYSTVPPHSTHVIAQRLKRITGLPWVADFRDPWADNSWLKERRSVRKQQIAERLESSCVANADRVIVNTPAMLDLFIDAYPHEPARKFVAIPNGFDPSLLATVDEIAQSLPQRPPHQRPIRICHPGSLYGGRDPRPFLAALKQLTDRGHRIEFHQVGIVEAGFGLGDFVEQHNLTGCVTFHGHVSHDAVLRHMAEADLLLILQPGTSTQIPAKLYEMLPFRRSILALTGTGATADIVSRYKIGTVADPEDVNEIASAIEKCIRQQQSGADGHTDAMDAFDGRTLTQRLATTFTELVCG